MIKGPLTGIAYKVAATLAFALMALIVKLLGDRFHVGQLVFFRSAFALIPVLSAVIWTGGGLRSLATKRPGAHALRSLAGSTAMFTGFAALTLLPLADATAIGFAAPIVTVVLAVFMLNETVRLYRWTAVGIGFAGVLMMLAPHLGAGQTPSLLGAAFALMGAIAAAFAMIFVRRMSIAGDGKEPAAVIAFYFQITAAALALLTLPFVWTTPAFPDLILLVLSGLLGGLGQLLLTNAYSHADASTIAPFDYVAMIWAVLFGWLFLSEWPVPLVLIGAAIVSVAGISIAWREHRLGLKRPPKDVV